MPLVRDSDVELRVNQLVGRARSHQIWFMFLDEQNIQLPLLMPMDDLPTAPADDDEHWLASRIRELCRACDAVSLIFVIERYAGEALTPQDANWARTLHRACDLAAVPLRALLLSHRGGVRWIAQDDYRFVG